MSNVSYSKKAFNDAVTKMRSYNEKSEEFLTKFPPEKLEIFLNNESYKNLYNTKFLTNKKLQLEFGVGVMNSILNFYYDGGSLNFKEYSKKVITEAFNYGNFQKMDKDSFYYSFDKILKNGGLFVEIGELWSKNFFLKNSFLQERNS